MREAAVADLAALITDLGRALPPLATHPDGAAGPTILYLVAATSHLAEGWRERVPRLELAVARGAPSVVAEAARRVGQTGVVPVVWESPADVIPLPSGWVDRARPVSGALGGASDALTVLHFDPYSVVLRLVTRGDEPDYLAALYYLRNGWIDMRWLERMLDEILPRCTSDTLAQDPAEFRRKFRGLRQVAEMDTTMRIAGANPDNLDRVSEGLHTRPSLADA